MARLEVAASWNTEKTADAVANAVEVIAAARRLWFTREEGTMVLQGGSQIRMRLLGGWFVNPTILPKRGTVTFDDGRVDLHLEEAMGIGYFDRRLRRKYRNEFDLIASRLADALAA